MSETQRFTFRFYFQTLTRMLGEPRKFFTGMPRGSGFKQPLGFLFVSSLFFSIASVVSNMCPSPLMMGSIFLLNAVGMVFIMSGLGYIVMTMTMGKRVSFARLFSIYAFSSGVTLLASWLPFFVWLTEPWKWWLIGAGMVKGCGFKLIQAVIIIVVSIGILLLFFWSLPILMMPCNPL